MNEQFTCECDGPINVKGDDLISHACQLKYSIATSYYDGVERLVDHRRNKINPEYTDGEIRYNWFVAWQTA